MAIPTLPNGEIKPLEVDFNPDDMTVGDVRLMKGHIRINPNDKNTYVQVLIQISEFLIHHTNWTEDEINQLKASELGEVMEMVRLSERAASVPLVSNDISEPGPAGAVTPFPTGVPTSSMLSNSDAIHKTLEAQSMPDGISVG